MSSSNIFEYPQVNIPPIVLNKKEETSIPPTSSPTSSHLETYTDINSSYDVSPQTRNYISFLPHSSKRELEVFDGEVNHPQRHLLSHNQFVSPTIRVKREKPETPPQKRKNKPIKYTEITQFDEEAMKYYVAGLSVVGLLILYRFMARTKY